MSVMSAHGHSALHAPIHTYSAPPQAYGFCAQVPAQVAEAVSGVQPPAPPYRGPLLHKSGIMQSWASERLSEYNSAELRVIPTTTVTKGSMWSDFQKCALSLWDVPCLSFCDVLT